MIIYCEDMSTTQRFTVKEAADHFKVTSLTIRRWIEAGKLKFEQPAGRGGKITVLVSPPR